MQMTGQLSTCYICNARGNHPRFSVREMMFGTQTSFEYFQCTNCGCLQISAIPSEIEQYYPSSYYSFQFSPDAPSHGRLYRWLQKQRCRTALFDRGFKLNAFLKRFVELPEELYKRQAGLPSGDVIKRARIPDFSARFLDVGCGSYSRWLNDLSIIGFTNLVGVDPFIARDYQRGNIEIRKKELRDIDGAYDLITFHHSLEHMPQQLEALVIARQHLTPNGTCLVRIPIVPSLAWELYGVNWVELDAPRHLFLHSVASITALAEKAGLELFDMAYDSVPFEFYGSEQYARGIALSDPRSLWVNPDSSLFSSEEMERFQRMTSEAIETGRAGRAGFYFRTAQ